MRLAGVSVREHGNGRNAARPVTAHDSAECAHRNAVSCGVRLQEPVYDSSRMYARARRDSPFLALLAAVVLASLPAVARTRAPIRTPRRMCIGIARQPPRSVP